MVTIGAERGFTPGHGAGRSALIAVSLMLCSGPRLAADDAPSAGVEFTRDIRPILSDACFRCHGPDAAKRKAGLRLDDEKAVFAGRDGVPAVAAGDPDGSELYRRLVTEDQGERMPPRGSPRGLSADQVALIRRWIAQGAKWQPHWSLIPPNRVPPPRVKAPGWTRNPVDTFVLSRLERAGLAPSPEAAKATLIRRVTLDLTGLPPTPVEVDAFVADMSPGAYERVVDRLLASPRYGERMAARWLDAARYADTNGYQTDGEREMWRWRDWVIDAYNRNMPFDQFTIEQLAGDLLPGATLDQKIATGFNRNHRGNAEGGIIPEEYAVEYVVDRVDTTATVWLGLTMACARCHDHKYDPIAQKEFYQVYAFFNNVPERGKAIKYGNSPPYIKAPTPRQQGDLAALEHELATAQARLERLEPELSSSLSAWESTRPAAPPAAWTIADGLVAQYDFDGSGVGVFAPGRVGQAAQFDGERLLEAGPVADFGFYDKFTLSAWIHPDDEHGGTILSRMSDAEDADGYAVVLRDGKVGVNLVKRWLDDALRVRTRRQLSPGRWSHVLVTYDGSRVAAGIRVYVDGRLEPLEVMLDDLNQDFRTKEPLRIGAGGGRQRRFRGGIDEVRIYGRVLDAEEAGVVSVPDPIGQILANRPQDRTPAEARKLRAYFVAEPSPGPIRDAYRLRDALRKRRDEFVDRLPTTMVMQEMSPRREAFVLRRGEYDKPGERVDAGVPACLPPLPAGSTRDRLAFARWLVDPSHPLTARVAVNRLWQQAFGTGLVRTVDDFGSQGEGPSHPELLDWLACELVGGGWDVRALLRTIVTSATYRQSSRVTPELLRRDPENRLLARGPRVRLPAEMIRDQALAAGGLLVERQGGPSVRPYQPAGLWKELGEADYVQDHGAGLYRRSLYTFWKRTVSPPTLMTFDASARETCAVREPRTNTPLQALTLLNEVTFVESARGFAERAMAEGGATPAERLGFAFRVATARSPSPRELGTLVAGFERHRGHYREHADEAKRLVETGESRAGEGLDASELAAYTAVSSLILNLDETITKE